jgi:trimeric autotransporter adhesin
MSTKTTFKRVALVAVAALGFGVLSSVAPATAAQVQATSIVVGAVPQARVGTTSFVPLKVYIPSGLSGTDTLIINAEVASAPVATAVNAASAFNAGGTIGGNDNGGYLCLNDVPAVCDNTDIAASSTEDHGRIDETRTTGIGTGAGTFTRVAASTTGAYTLTSAEKTQGYVELYAAVTPDVAGNYVIMVSTHPDTNRASATSTEVYAAGDVSATFTLSTSGAPTGVAIAQIAGGAIHAGSPNGVPLSITLSGGLLSGVESIDVIASGASGAVSATAGGTYTTTLGLTPTNFTNGVATVWLKSTGTAAGTISLTTRGGGALPASVTATKTFTVNAATGSATAMTEEAPATTATYAMTNATGGAAGTSTITVTELSTSQKLGFTFTDYAATRYGYVTVTDTAGKITGVANTVYDQAYSVASGDVGTSISFAAVSTSAATLFTVAIPAASATTLGTATAVTKTFASAARDGANGTFTFTPASTIVAAPGAAVALGATIKDRFGAAYANRTVTITTSGRNNPAATTAVTDSAGKVTFTTADTAAATSLLLTDTVTFSGTALTSASVTINYGSAAVSTVVVTGGYTTDGVDALVPTTNDIGAATAGAAGVGHTFTATVKDANGNALAGVAVAWTIAGTGCAVKSTTATTYTSSTGVATATSGIYGWLAGTCTVTATAGGKTGTAKILFENVTTTEARTISATADGVVVTATVKDRYGNPIKGVAVYATKTGAGYFGNGLARTTTNTDKNGQAQFNVAGGDASVTVSVIDYDAATGTTFGQTCALKGYGTCPTATSATGTILTATTVGTTTTAETGVGATYDAAGIASATVSVAGDTSAQAAADAAAEATDAANAATDAANAAAEAADAATAAAQDAADAVAALSTQVSEMVDALKKQITALTNLVIKIQKKVKA